MNNVEVERRKKIGIEVNQVFRMNDLVRGNDAIFATTGVTDGELLCGIRFTNAYSETHSLVMCSKSGTTRFVETIISINKKPHLVMQD